MTGILMKDELPKRKHPRLREYDYGKNGAYFITVCVKDKKQILGTVIAGNSDLVGRADPSAPRRHRQPNNTHHSERSNTFIKNAKNPMPESTLIINSPSE